jgi:hypothetical protein
MAEMDTNALVAKIFGIVLLLVGLLGFYLTGTGSGALLGIFGVNLLHNSVHVITGIVLVLVGFMWMGQYARITNQVLGIVYVLVALFGFAMPSSTLIASNVDAPMYADAVLHIVIGIVLAGVGFGVKAKMAAGTAQNM